MRSKYLSISAIFLFVLSPMAFAETEMLAVVQGELQVLRQAVTELKLQLAEQTHIIQSQGDQIARLSQGKIEPSHTKEVISGGSFEHKSWIPEIGVGADMVANFDSPKIDEEGSDRLSVREVEIAFASAVDAYSKFDATVSFSDFEDPALEEAYLTHFALPWEITGRFGKMKPKVGKAISVHRDSLETVDEPLVIRQYFGIEGYNKTGADFTKGLDWNWPLPQEITFGVLEGGNGEEGTLFGDARRRPTIYSHLETYLELSSAAGLELGVTHLAGSKDEDASLEVQVMGLDATLIHRYEPNRHLKLQSEAFFVHRQESNLDPDESTDLRINESPWGIYALADIRFADRWSSGFRFDYAEPIDNPIVNPHDADHSYTGYLTFHQSEFARWRVQFTHIQQADDTHNNQVMIQGTFAIGEHKHKIQ